MTVPKITTFREFANLVPCRPGYVTQLKREDHLVLTADGKRVKVRESLQQSNIPATLQNPACPRATPPRAPTAGMSRRMPTSAT